MNPFASEQQVHFRAQYTLSLIHKARTRQIRVPNECADWRKAVVPCQHAQALRITQKIEGLGRDRVYAGKKEDYSKVRSTRPSNAKKKIRLVEA